MRRAMAEAEVGDDVYAEDPTVTALEERVAGMFGHEAALFVPSGTMGNQIGMRLVCEPGQEVLCDADAHVVTYEMGAAAAIFGISTRTVVSGLLGRDGGRGHGRLSADALIEQVRPKGDWHLTSTAAIAVENSHNRGGGLVQPLDELQKLWGWSRGAGVAVHGGMRQVGVLAAACLYALDHHLDRLAEDHEHAQLLAKRLGVDPSGVETNMVVLDDVAAPVIAEAAKAEGVLVSQVSRRRIRLVTHLDVDRAAVDRAADVLAELLNR
jgi:threonine aldolase